MMKRTLAIAAAVALAAILSHTATSHAQPAPGNFAQSYAVAAAVAASGPASAVRSVNVGKTYQVSGQTSASTGSAVVAIEGSNNSATWDVIGTVTLTLGTTPTSGSFVSLDRYVFVRANASALSGTGAAYTATLGY